MVSAQRVAWIHRNLALCTLFTLVCASFFVVVMQTAENGADPDIDAFMGGESLISSLSVSIYATVQLSARMTVHPQLI